MTTFSIGIPVWPEFLEPWVWDTNRRMAVVGYDAVERLGFCNPSRYPLINIHTAVVSSMMLGNPGPDGYDAGWKTAAMFFENRGGIGSKSRGYLIKQNLVAIHAIINAIAYDELEAVDPIDGMKFRTGAARSTPQTSGPINGPISGEYSNCCRRDFLRPAIENRLLCPGNNICPGLEGGDLRSTVKDRSKIIGSSI